MRSQETELLDRDDIPFADIARNMQELDTINSWLGGHQITLWGFRKLLGKKQEVHVCEIGSGGGDNLRAIQRWCEKKQIRARFTGIDIKASCLDYARSRWNGGQVDWICADYKDVRFIDKPDIIFSSLFCHHFSDLELKHMMLWKQAHCKTGFFINDLHRHPLAEYSIRWITRMFSSSYLVKHDAPMSVRRAFSREDFQKIFQGTGMQPDIHWRWAFRWLITVTNETYRNL
jgi:SAM-dependent methyltransferase